MVFVFACAHSFVAKVVSDAAKTDKPAKLVLFDDGAEVQFYTEPHPRAKKGQKHIHMMNENIKYEVHAA